MKILIASFLTLFSFQLFGQQNINGKITDKNNLPLEGVDIYSPNLHRGTTTNAEGLYFLNNVPSNSIQLVFTFMGYQTISKTLVPAKGEIELNLILEESVFEMDEIIISTPFYKLQSENVMKVEHKSIKQMQLEGASSLIEGISKLAGVSQISTGAGIGKPVIRGLSGNRVLVYSQGVRLENQQFGDEHGLGLNELGVESVEVIKGPASLLYGSDALGGVLYFNPEKFANAHSSQSKLRQTFNFNTLGFNSSYLIKASTEKLKFLSALGYQSNSDYKVYDQERVTNSRFNEFDFKAGIAYDIHNYSTEIRFNYNRANLGLADGIFEQSTSKTLQIPYQNIDNIIVSAHNHLFLKNSKLNLNLGYITNNRKEFAEENSSMNPDPELFMKLKTFNYDLKYHLPSSKNFETIVGMQGLFQDNSNRAEELLIPNAHVFDVGLLATSSYHINEHYFQGGLRFDHRSIKTQLHVLDDRTFEPIDRSFKSFTASLGYKHTFKKAFEVRINMASGFRAPNLAELASNGVHEGTNRYEIGNPDLKTEQNLQFDLALEYKNEHIEVFTNGFYNAIDNYIFIAPTGMTIDTDEEFTYKQENAALYGAEIGLHLHPHPLDWLHIESSFETVVGKQKNDEFLPLIPANKLKNTLRTEFKINKWLTNLNASLNLESYFAQKKVSTFETSTPAYQLFNIGLSGNLHLNKIDVNTNININNLFNTNYISHLSRLKSSGIPNMGRAIIIGINFVI